MSRLELIAAEVWFFILTFSVGGWCLWMLSKVFEYMKNGG